MRRRLRPGTIGAVLVGLAMLGHALAGPVEDPGPATQPAEAPAAQPASQPAGQPPGPRPLPEIPHGGNVTMIRIDGTIDLGLAPFIERVVESTGSGDLLVLDINTLGGRVDAAIVIRDALLHAHSRTVCWVNPRAISAGALIALACDVIAVAPGATIGAATPIQIGQGGEAKPVEEKGVSYVRKEFAATAIAKGRNGLIAEAMVDADVEVPGLDEKGKLLTLEGTQAITWGIAEIEAADEAQLWQRLGRPAPATIRRPHLSWAERLARFLSDPILSGLLMTLGMLGIIIELYSPGHGVSLAVGLCCLALFFFGHHVVKLAGWEEILLFLVGVVLLGVEVFVPGHILPGVLGALAIVASLVMALVNLEHVPIRIAWQLGWLPRALGTVFGSITATAVAGWGIGKLLPRTRIGQPLILGAAIQARANESARPALEGAVGQAGTVVSDLRPVGKVLVGGQRLEATAERGYLAAGRRVVVVRVEGTHVVVREAPREES